MISLRSLAFILTLNAKVLSNDVGSVPCLDFISLPPIDLSNFTFLLTHKTFTS